MVRKRPRVEPTDDWKQLKLLFGWPEQVRYEELRPLVLFGSSVAERAIEIKAAERTLYRRMDRFETEGEEVRYMSEDHWGVFFTDDNGGTWLVAIRGDEESAIEEARELDEEKGLTWEENVHSVEAIPDELAAEAADQLAEGERVLVRAL